ncbi:MAG: acyl carrier protein [Chlorobiaceae bacterium]|nr:acyl carrier protein [Chlorobiaceae bacterium]NTW73701.1 acyl carrier protein [Chlorobiaceae bacterium]
MTIPTTDTIREHIVGYLAESFPLFMSDTADDTPLADQGVDSLGMTNIVVYLEQQFQIAIDDAEITRKNLGSVQGIVNFVNNKLSV